MRLRELIKNLEARQIEGPLDHEIVGVAYDSRRVTPGMVFVAVPGQNVDGHDYINSAIDRGASAIVCAHNGFSSSKATKIVVSDPRQALARLAAAFYRHPSAGLRVIGVTGTNGKTTVAFALKRILETAGAKTGLVGTIRYEIGERMIPAHRTTPEALEIQQMLAQMLQAGCQACVMEVSSHALDQQRVLGVEFDAAIFTNLTRDHLDWHGDMDAYFAAKEKLFIPAEPGGKKCAAVINLDDPYGERLAKRGDLAVRVTYGLGEAAEVRATEIKLGPDGTRFTVNYSGRRLVCRFPLIGRHNVYNALAAAGAGLALGVDEQTVQLALNRMSPVPGRLEAVECGQPFGVLVDYAHTDDALENVLNTVREITANRIVLVFGCGGSRDKSKRPRMGRVAARLADFSLITSDNPRRESPAEIAAQVEAGFREARADGYRIELDRRHAIEAAMAMARKGDTVLIAGKGHETYQEFHDTVVPFDDRVHARETLEGLGFGSPTEGAGG